MGEPDKSAAEQADSLDARALAETLQEALDDAAKTVHRNGHHLAQGTKIGRYLVIERLGAGGMGTVYAAYDPELDRKVAIKLVRADPSGSEGSGGAKARLLREAQAMARL